MPMSKTEPFCCHKLGETRGTEPWTSQGSCDLRNAQFVPFLLENFEGGRKIVNWSALTLSGIHGALLRMSHVFRTSNDQRCGLSFNSSVARSYVANNILYIYIYCQREPGARCMSHMHVSLHYKRPLWLKRPLKGKRSRDARYALLGFGGPQH